MAANKLAANKPAPNRPANADTGQHMAATPILTPIPITTPTAPGWLLPCDSQARLLTGPPAGTSVGTSAGASVGTSAGAPARPPISPWACYLRLAHGQIVGGGGFAAAPAQGRVEMGYFTLPGWQHQGHGQATAAALLAIARAADAGLTVTATTVRTPGSSADASPSGRILLRLGFGPAVPAQDADAGPVWHWAAKPLNAARKPTHRCGPAPPSTPARTSPCPVPP